MAMAEKLSLMCPLRRREQKGSSCTVCRNRLARKEGKGMSLFDLPEMARLIEPNSETAVIRTIIHSRLAGGTPVKPAVPVCYSGAKQPVSNRPIVMKCEMTIRLCYRRWYRPWNEWYAEYYTCNCHYQHACQDYHSSLTDSIPPQGLMNVAQFSFIAETQL